MENQVLTKSAGTELASSVVAVGILGLCAWAIVKVIRESTPLSDFTERAERNLLQRMVRGKSR